MKLCVLGPSLKAMGYSTKKLIEEARKAGFKVDPVPVINVKLVVKNKLDAVYNKNSLSKYDYILPRIDSKRASIGYPVMRFLDLLGVRKPYSAETILIAHNKFISLERLAYSGIAVPETYLTGSKNVATDIVKNGKLPMMLKLLSGFGGRGVMVMESKEAAQSTIETMQTLKQEILIEKFLKNPGEDIRGVIAGDEMIASYKRVAAAGEMRSNIHAGGRGEAFKLTPEMEEIAFKAAKSVGAKLCAVDMIESSGESNVLEVNINPGFKSIDETTGINVAKRMIDFVKREVRA
jgi:ribosomal protein S6--L-glutamate ligase